ncbi:hypothetical protein HMI54_002501, partial [Coelomomyces lativittatus]
MFILAEQHVLDTVSADAYFDRIHTTLKSILATIPSGPTFVITLLEMNFPHRRLPLVQHQMYIQNVLKLLDYVPLLREAILLLILEKLTLIDIDIQTDLEDFEPSERDDQFFIEMNGFVPPTVDSSSTSLSVSQTSFSSSQSDSAISLMEDSDSDMECGTTTLALNTEALAIKLDHALNLLFSYIQNQSTSDPSMLQETVVACIKLFEKIMLPMFRSKYCQFLIFRLCAFDASFTDQFLGLLAKKIMDVSEPPLIRINATLYMASFLARARFVSVEDHVKPCFQLLILFVHAFVANNEHYVKQPNVEKFGVFYAATQAVLYLFCFHWKTLCDEEHGLGNKGGLYGFERVLLSKFNPLMVLKPFIVEEFARITHALNILHCYAIIQRNKRLFLPSQTTSSSTTAHTFSSYSPQVLDSFFPFEPMMLPLTKEWIDPFYVEYEPCSFPDPSSVFTSSLTTPSSFSLSSTSISEPTSFAHDLPMSLPIDRYVF